MMQPAEAKLEWRNDAHPQGRLDLVDVARGLALIAMVVFHGAWDLSNADLIATDINSHAGWQWFARSIAASFLTITGVSLVLAHGKGFGAGFDRQRFLRRWLILAGAAALVSIGTYFMFPDGYVFFGILHHIALASLLALPFLSWSPLLVGAAAIAAIALPQIFRSGLFDPTWLIWTGLAQRVPDTVDFVPFFPWFGFVLAGVALGRIGKAWLLHQGWQAEGRLKKLTALAGRNSLVFYLVHQPILLGLIWLYQSLPFPGAMDSMQRFDRDCRAVCKEQGAPVDFCTKACACTSDAIKADAGLGESVRTGKLDARHNQKLTELSQICSRATSNTEGGTKP